jgi:hypothetical protein
MVPPSHGKIARLAPAPVNRANLHANVQFMTVMATKMPYISRG